MDPGERVLWERRDGRWDVFCVMRSCCAGAELQIRVSSAVVGERIALREMYPSKSDLYERARQLHDEFVAADVVS